MSEEILAALMQLFAIIAIQDEGIEANEIVYVEKFLTQQLNQEAVKEYMVKFREFLGEKSSKQIRVNQSVKVLGICRKINKNLNQGQKIVVLVRLFELMNTERKFSDQRMAIINTVAEVFNISKEEFTNIETFAIKNELEQIDNQRILVANDSSFPFQHSKYLKTEPLDGSIIILQVKSTDLYFLRYTGSQDVLLNGLTLNKKRIYLFASGSTIKLPKGKPIYYSDISSKFLSDVTTTKLSFNVNNLSLRFPNGELGLRKVNFSESHGKLVGIMGASGAGKTTLLNVLSGISDPTEGEVLINGLNLHTQKDQLEGVIGYIPQDDLLIEELTVFENLYFSAKQCFRDKTEEEIVELVDRTLKSLGLFHRKDLRVGNALNKLISGGQRKRLNIALELIREPSILFVDEPTSGLSSRDSENVMDLLSELSLKGKLIFVVIHQPSSDIFKMFDKMMILDTGGYMIFYGNPVESLVYFKHIDQQVNSDVGECPNCGNVTPELIFNIVEAQVVDEFGKYTEKRKVSPVEWEEHFKKNINIEKYEDINEKPPASLNIPGKIQQFKIYALRDLFTKISNTQYIIINLLEAPLLAFILASIIRYISDPKSSIYIFRENENIPPYIFMAVIVALFLGLTVSAEEIFRDRKILKREKFLNLSRTSYLASKVLILFSISAIQSLLFVIVGNLILGIKGMYFEYWYIMFTTSAFANILGLNISASFNSAVTIYILIPLLMIPQMALGGAMFSFDKLNRVLGTVGKVPWIAEFMPSRWSYEALIVNQFKNNEFEKKVYKLELLESVAGYKSQYYCPELVNCIDEIKVAVETPSIKNILRANEDFALLKNELSKEIKRTQLAPPDHMMENLCFSKFTEEFGDELLAFFKEIDSYYTVKSNIANNKRQNYIEKLEKEKPGFYNKFRDEYHNEAASEYVKKVYEKHKIIRNGHELIQQTDPVFLYPEQEGMFSFRCHFYAPVKYFLGEFIDTLWFNSFVVWFITILSYITLYFEVLKKILDSADKLDLKRYKKIFFNKRIFKFVKK